MEKLSFELGALATLAKHEHQVEAIVICSQLNELARERSLQIRMNDEGQARALELPAVIARMCHSRSDLGFERLQVPSEVSADAPPAGVPHTGVGEPTGPPVIRATNLTLAHPGRTVLHDVNLSVHAGEVVLIVGP